MSEDVRPEQPARERDSAGEPGAAPVPARRNERGSRRRARKPKQGGSFLKELPIVVGLALVFSVLIKTFLAQAFFIPSGSMENTLLLDDRVIVNKLDGEIERGDIVVFRDPGGWLSALPPAVEEPDGLAGVVRDVLVFLGLAPAGSEEDLIKRVIGEGGDDVVCCDEMGRITVNDVPLDEDYLFPGDVPSQMEFDVTVPEGSLWLLGDHRSISRDARQHLADERGGMVPVDAVIGTAFVRVWPLDRFMFFDTPETFEQPALTDAG